VKELLVTGLFLTIPLVVSGILHMAVVRKDVLGFLKKPVSLSAFGPNKTWRGFVVMPVLTIIGVVIAKLVEPAFGDGLLVRLTSESTWLIGTALGLAYVASELPNSYVKRRIGIAPGQLPEKNRALYVIIDQADSAVGCALVYLALMHIGGALTVLLCVLGPGVHLLVNLLLFVVGLRKRPV
jgi:CDP-diacylglycerol--serine O-phosphatidyltransferase